MYNVNLQWPYCLSVKYTFQFSPDLSLKQETQTCPGTWADHIHNDKCPVLQSYIPAGTVTQSLPSFIGSILIQSYAAEFLLPNFEI